MSTRIKAPIDDTILAILRVNRSISNEVLRSFYGVNNFRFPLEPSLQLWRAPSQPFRGIALIPAGSQAFLRRIFLSFEIFLNGEGIYRASYRASQLAKFTEQIASSKYLLLQTFTVAFWHRSTNDLTEAEPVMFEILEEANRLGFSDARKRMANDKGTLSILMGLSPWKERAFRLVEKPIWKKGTRYTSLSYQRVTAKLKLVVDLDILSAPRQARFSMRTTQITASKGVYQTRKSSETLIHIWRATW